jgi:hypothetical protein
MGMIVPIAPAITMIIPMNTIIPIAMPPIMIRPPTRG